MGTPKYGIAADWAKHLRPKGRKKFWKKLRRKNKKDIAEARQEAA
jgi:hypothetical protein